MRLCHRIAAVCLAASLADNPVAAHAGAYCFTSPNTVTRSAAFQFHAIPPKPVAAYAIPTAESFYIRQNVPVDQPFFAVALNTWWGKVFEIAVRGPEAVDVFLKTPLAANYLRTLSERAHTLMVKGEMEELVKYIAFEVAPALETAKYFGDPIQKWLGIHEQEIALEQGDKAGLKQELRFLIESGIGLTLTAHATVLPFGTDIAVPLSEAQGQRMVRKLNRWSRSLRTRVYQHIDHPLSPEDLAASMTRARSQMTHHHREHNKRVSQGKAGENDPYYVASPLDRAA